MKISNELKAIHQHTANHREEILRSSRCYCINCLRNYKPEEIEEWVDDDDTALCPHCYVDAVVGDASGFNLTPTLLRALHKTYFSY